jgi:uncharacterized membrane protein
MSGIQMEEIRYYPSHHLGDRVRQFERWAGFATASAALLYGFRRRSQARVWVAIAAAPLAYRGLVGQWPWVTSADEVQGDTRVALAGETAGIHVREAIRLEKPLSEVFRFWRRLENLPRFMTHLARVTELDDRRSHWVAIGPGGLRVEWDAEIVNEVEDKVLGWRSLPGSDVVTAGSVTFSPTPRGNATQVSVHLQYVPPAGRAGRALSMILGRDPSQMIREDLRHLKQLLETGEIARGTPVPARSAR